MERNRPRITNYRQDFSSLRNTNWISAHQYARINHRKVDDGTAKIMTGIAITFLLMFIIAIAL